MKVSQDDLLGALTDEMSATELAEDMGVSRMTVVRAAARHGVKLRHGKETTPFLEIKRAAEDMAAGDAVYFLLNTLKEVLQPAEAGIEIEGVHLPPKERAILSLLYAREPNTVPHGAIFEALYASSLDAPDPKIVAVFICKLRAKIEGQPFRVVTDWGRGFRFERDAGHVFPWEVEQ